jgi:uncharacterized membrane protein
MASLSDAKTLGGIGSILVLLTIVPAAGPILGIVGFVLVLIAVKYISDAVADSQIFQNMLISVIFSIGAVAVGAVTVVGTVLRVMGMGTYVGSSFELSKNIPVGDWMGLAAGVLAGLAVVWALLIVSAVFLRRSYGTVATKLNDNKFSTAGLLYLIGAATAIIGVGFILIFVAQIYLAVAFFSIPEKVSQTQTSTTPATT